ncbi:uncharacterized protein BT62DRAFT_546815 [Guyanagaster necrorhizus]|uniref:Uncharacterized protein n=1 Tax=Guyanagaster necrorhizus TaxID=856835 RepID=A0A9P7VHP1_9AGAR|nr:uncharacterized protein BT62DRAFT_546815 [Guyanagaster necrorhizus MCA 3950]KAG7441241.1 hypothetical protein BT62DRAFT_546815 [Guyanagaster necrorhizus MCA 3950]
MISGSGHPNVASAGTVILDYPDRETVKCIRSEWSSFSSVRLYVFGCVFSIFLNEEFQRRVDLFVADCLLNRHLFLMQVPNSRAQSAALPQSRPRNQNVVTEPFGKI